MLVASTGSWKDSRVQGDVTGPLGFDGALRGRLDGLYENRNYFYDTATLKRKTIFAALESELTSATLLTVGGSSRWDDAIPFASGLPLYPDGSDPHLPPHTALTFDWARRRTRTREIYVQLQQKFNSNWKLKINTTVWKGSVEFAYGNFLSPIDPLTNSLRSAANAVVTTRPNTHDQFAFDLTLTAAFDWLGHRAQAAVGGDLTITLTPGGFLAFTSLQGEGYLETDFVSAGTSSISYESNGYTLRVRQAYLRWSRPDLGWAIVAGQAWSLVTRYKSGLTVREEDIPFKQLPLVRGFDREDID
jgi:hypothetical protein